MWVFRIQKKGRTQIIFPNVSQINFFHVAQILFCTWNSPGLWMFYVLHNQRWKKKGKGKESEERERKKRERQKEMREEWRKEANKQAKEHTHKHTVCFCFISSSFTCTFHLWSIWTQRDLHSNFIDTQSLNDEHLTPTTHQEKSWRVKLINIIKSHKVCVCVWCDVFLMELISQAFHSLQLGVDFTDTSTSGKWRISDVRSGRLVLHQNFIFYKLPSVYEGNKTCLSYCWHSKEQTSPLINFVNLNDYFLNIVAI